MQDIVIRQAHINDAPAFARVLIYATQDAFRGRVPDPYLNWITPEDSATNWAKNLKAEQGLEVGDFLSAGRI